jgi:Ca2+-binding RTX toxin-like protein
VRHIRLARGLLLGAALLALAAPDAALAGTLGIQEVVPDPSTGTVVQVVTFQAEPGERNAISLSFGPDQAAFTDHAGVIAAAPCTQVDENSARCPLTRPDRSFRLALGGLSDIASILGADGRGRPIGGTVIAGGGGDVIDGPEGATFYDGGTGVDRLEGGAANDVFDEGGGRNGSDTIIGNGGRDRVSYADRRRRVFASLDGRRNDGQRGERDRLMSIEDLEGGHASDRLIGNRHSNAIVGDGGSDLIAGGKANDRLSAASGETTDGASRGRDRIRGGTGDDVLYGSAGPNLIDPGEGRDAVFAGAGSDRIRARDRSLDQVQCAAGVDRLSLDGLDFIAGDAVAGFCERVDRSAPAGPGLFDRALAVSGSAAEARLDCPADVRAGCTGTVSVRRESRVLGAAGFSLPAGATGSFEVPITPADVQAVRSAGGTLGATVAIAFTRRASQLERRFGALLVAR